MALMQIGGSIQERIGTENIGIRDSMQEGELGTWELMTDTRLKSENESLEMG